MSTVSDPRSFGPTRVHNEAQVRPPPVRATGAVAWMRKNLFATPFDTIVTIITVSILFWMVSGFLTWAIGQANWLVVTRNFRLFMAGTFPIESMWRVELTALLCALAVGFSIYAYLRLPRWVPWALIVLAAVLIVVPPVLFAVTPPAPSLLAAGDADIASGTVTEAPIAQLGFIGRAGETISLEIHPVADDNALAGSAGFSDRASAALINGSRAVLRAEARRVELENQLAGNALTARQRTAAGDELSGMAIPASPLESYAVNQGAVQIRLINPDSGEVIAEGSVEPDGAPFTAVLPYDGWYILDKSVDGDAVGLLRTTGIEPVIERGLTSGLVYTRVLDDFTVARPRPKVDDKEIPYVSLTDNQWQGLRSLPQFLHIFAAPMLGMLARGLLPLMAVGVVGYGLGWALGRVTPRPEREKSNPRWAAQRALFPVWVVVLGLSSLLLVGLSGFGPVAVGSVLARFVWVGWMYFTGMAFNRAWGRPLFGLLIIMAVFQSLLEQGLLAGRIGSDMVGLIVNFFIWLAIGAYAARRGAASRGLLNTRRLVWAILICAGLWLALLLIPLLTGASGEPLPAIDTRRWGGLLLTAVITVVALVASFPIGILLALGRRSSLPLIRGVCTVYIELVRGVPLITVLFMAMLLVPLLNPGLASVENAFRAMVGFTLFSAAYLAENVRGGLQSVPPSQEEAGRALGLSGWQVIILITLPQALRAVIPALVGQCISLFKDTSLVALVGLTDLTGISKGVISQAEYVGLQTEVYVFISVIYFIFSYAMAYVSRRIEASGSGKARRL